MRRIIALIIVVMAVTTLQAQPKGGGGERFDEMQSNLIAHKLGLEGERRMQFEKIYKEFTSNTQGNKPRGHRDGFRKPPMMERSGEVRSDDEIEAQILDAFEQSIKATEEKRNFYHKFREILSPKEILRMYEIERKIRERILAEQRQRQHPNAER